MYGGERLWTDGTVVDRATDAGTDACGACLRRARLLALLAPYLEKTAGVARGRRVGELLALEDRRLLEAIAPKHADRLLAERDSVTVEELRREVDDAGSWSTCRHRPDYPSGLRNLRDGPAAIFGRGDRGLLSGLSPERAVTVVGARRASSYGMGVARDLARELAMAGMTVVSGLALGIDGAAHTGALEAGSSCAVLGGGVNFIYPPRHRSLYERHLAGGIILSELPVGTKVWRWMFPARNRLMAAISAMTVVVEARLRSGSLITATMAQELGRDLGAVPGPVTSAVSRGPNELISAGACVVRDAQDVLDCVLGVGHERLAYGPKLDPDLHRALEAFELSNGDLDGFAAGLGESGPEPTATLARLELAGYLSCNETGRWSRTTLKVPESNAQGTRRLGSSSG